MAVKYLTERGYKISHRNWYCRWGELDIIAISPDDVLVFVEVKSGRSKKFGEPVEWITHTKREHLLESARQFILENQIDDVPLRFDVITIDLASGKIKHFINAFGAD